MQNLFKEIAEAKNLELGEEFFLNTTGEDASEILKYKDSPICRITEDGMEYLDNNVWEFVDSYCERDFLKGVYSVVKLPFNPNLGENYYYIRFWEEGENTFKTSIAVRKNANSALDFLVRNFNGCFKTFNEAKDNIKPYFKAVTGKDLKEVHLIAPPNYVC